jgi:hypothetical protein
MDSDKPLRVAARGVETLRGPAVNLAGSAGKLVTGWVIVHVVREQRQLLNDTVAA